MIEIRLFLKLCININIIKYVMFPEKIKSIFRNTYGKKSYHKSNIYIKKNAFELYSI